MMHDGYKANSDLKTPPPKHPVLTKRTTKKRWTEEDIAERLYFLVERLHELENRVSDLENDNGKDDDEPESVSKILHIPPKK